MKRVVVTGMSGITSLGETAEKIFEQFAQGKSGIRYMPDWEIYPDLRSKLAGPVESFTVPKHFNRKVTRGMGRVALMSTVCAEKALEDAGLLHADILKSGDAGVAFGSSAGSVDAVREFGAMLIEHNMSQLNATTYIRMMSHTSAVNMTVYFGLKGLTLPTSSACTSVQRVQPCSMCYWRPVCKMTIQRKPHVHLMQAEMVWWWVKAQVV